MTIVEMREKRAKLWNTMEGFLDTHRNDKGVLSAEDDATYATMEQDLNDLSNEIRRMERRDAMEAELNKPVNHPIIAQPERHEAEKQGRASNAYKEDFGRHLRGKNPIHNVLSESSDQDGGYLVPEEFERDVITGLDEANVVRSLAKVITTQNDRKIPVAVGHSAATWTAENDAFTESNPTFGQKVIDAYKLTDLIRVSVELLQDSAFPLEQYIANEFARAFGIAEEQAFCVGTGSGQPTGIFSANGRQVGVTAAANNAITADELINLVYALKAPYRRNAKFLMNDATISQIRKLKDGNGVYLWQPSLQAGEPDKLLGSDLYTSPYAPTMAADAFTVAFGDFKNYWMTHEEVMAMLSGLDISFAYDHFCEGEAPEPPFICFLFPGSDNFSADNVVYAAFEELHIELYTDEKDPELEESVEAVLTGHELFWQKTEVWIESEKLYEVLYRMTV